jgi:endonuclease-3
LTNADRPQIKRILKLLEKKYGKKNLIPNHDPLSELVQTILSQNTSDVNSRPAFKALKSSFGSWENILNADVSLIAGAIKSGGLAQIKAERIQRALMYIKQRRGDLDLNFLSRLPVHEARAWLMQLPGVGNKTANCVLLFALGRPALPVDTHIFRVSERLRLIAKKTSLEEAHQALGKMIFPDDIYRFHVLMIEHGRNTCIARHPRCSQCVLQKICPSYEIFTAVLLKKG